MKQLTKRKPPKLSTVQIAGDVHRLLAQAARKADGKIGAMATRIIRTALTDGKGGQ